MVYCPAILAQSWDNYKFSFFSIEDGLSATTARQVVGDKYGFYWIGTQNGLNKFDGKHFTHFTSNNKNKRRRLLGIDCLKLHYDGDSLLFVLNGIEGLNIVNVVRNEVVKKIPIYEITGSRHHAPFCYEITPFKNFMVIGSQNHLFFYDIKNNIVSKRIALDKYGEMNLIFVLEYKDKLYFATDQMHLYAMTNDLNDYYPIYKLKIKNNPFLYDSDVALDRSFAYIANSYGVERLIMDTTISSALLVELYPHYFENSLYGYTSFSLYNDNFFFSNNRGLWMINPTLQSEILLKMNSHAGYNAYFQNARHLSIEKDKIFVCSDKGLAMGVMSRFNNIRYDNVDANIGLSQVYIINHLAPHLYINCKDGLYQYDISTKQISQTSIGYSGMSYVLEDNTIILTSANESYVYYPANKSKQLLSKVYPELKHLHNGFMTKMIPLGNQRYVYTTENNTGVYLWDKAKKIERCITGLEHPISKDYLINNLLLHNGNLMIIAESEVTIVDTTDFNIIKKVNIRDLGIDRPGIFMDLAIDGDDYWLGLYGYGAAIVDRDFKVKKKYEIADGLSSSGVFKVIPTERFVFVTTTNGLNVIEKCNDKVRTYHKSDNLHGDAFEELSATVVDSMLYMGGVGGVTFLDYNKYYIDTTAPKLYMSSVSILTDDNITIDTSHLFLTSMAVPNNAQTVKVQFTGLYYPNPERVQYEYMIDDKSWVSNGHQSFIDFVGMSPGTYDLKVRAFVEPGFYSSVHQMQLSFLPKWYQSIWFRIAMIVLLASIFYGLYRWRLKQMRQVYLVRQKISQDLHDDVSSSLSSIRMYSEVAGMTDDKQPIIQAIQTNTQDALVKIDDIVWGNDPKYDTIQHIIDKINQVFLHIFNNRKIAFSIEGLSVIDYGRELRPITRQTLYLIIKEAINNALKYSQCTKLSLVWSVDRKYISCIIQDNGQGFDKAVSHQRNGLINMQQRALAAKGSCSITSSPDGTSITVKLAL